MDSAKIAYDTIKGRPRYQNSLYDTTKSRPSSNHNSKKTPMEEAKIAKEAIRGRPSSNHNFTKTPME
jgi:hypothetical protein